MLRFESGLDSEIAINQRS